MSDTQEPSVTITPKLLGFMSSIIIVSGLIFTGFSAVTGVNYRLERVEQDTKILATDISNVSARLNELNTQLVTLTITLSKVEERLNARLEKK